MRAREVDENKIIQAIEKGRAIRTDELTVMCNCAPRTLYFKLQNYEYQTSINFNRKFITLKGIPQYQQNGLWECRGAIFSKWGRLKETIVKLVEKSPRGMTPTQLSNLVKTTITPQLIALRKEKRLVSRKYGRNHLYFAADKKRQKEQQKAFEEKWTQKVQPKLNRDMVIQILLAIIKYQETEPRKIQEILKANKVYVKVNDIEWLLKKHDIKKKP